MVRRFAFPTLACFVALVPAPAGAARPAGFPTVGLGLALDLPQATIAEDVDYARDPTTVFLELPVVVGAFRVAPELGFGMGASATELRWVSAADRKPGWVRGDTVDEQRLVLGLSAGPAFRLGGDMRAWLGARGGVAVRRTDFADDRHDQVGVDWSVGTVFGGETFLLERFSLGGEGRLGFTSMDDAVLVPGSGASPTFRRGWSLGFDLLACACLYLR